MKGNYISNVPYQYMLGPAANALYNSATSYFSAKPPNTMRGSRNRGAYPAYGRRTRSGRKSFKSKVMSLHPAKHYTGETVPSLLHNSVVSMVPTQGITQGDGNSNRDGDAIHLEALKLRGSFVSFATSGAYQYRILVGWSGEEYTTSGIASGLVSAIGSTEIFLPSTQTWLNSAIVNPKAFTVLYDQTIDVNSQITATQDITNFNVTVPIHQNFNYQSSGSVQGKNRNLYVVVIGSVTGGTNGTTSAGQILLAYDLLFKNT